MKNRIIFLYLFLFLFLLSFSLFSQEEPYWVYLKRAENLKQKGYFAEAIIEARKSKKAFIEEKLKKYYEKIKNENRNLIEYELTKMVEEKEKELRQNDDFPQYHELLGDLYIITDFLDEALNEYEEALSQREFFEYPQKYIEIKYKIAGIHNKKMNYELEDIYYREIAGEYLSKKNKEYWARVRFNIKNDPSLSRVFRIYRIDGIEYLQALYKIGRRSALLERNSDALFYLANAAIVWMSYYSKLIKKYHYDFQYASPTDFINYITKKQIYEYQSEDYIIDEILFFIGYVYRLEGQNDIRDHYYNLAMIFSKGTKREKDIKNLIEYLKKDEDHILTYEELLN